MKFFTMNKLAIMSLTLVSMQAFANDNNKVILAGSGKGKINRTEIQDCSLTEQTFTTKDGESHRHMRVNIVAANKGGQELKDSIALFNIDQEGKIYKPNYSTRSYAGALTDQEKKYGYEFEASNRRIYFNNNDSGERNIIDVRMKDGDLTKVKSITWKQGASPALRILLAVPAAIFGADTHGNDLKCTFDN